VFSHKKYSLEITAHRVTSMADTDIDAVRKQKKAEYAKQYRLKGKLLLQQQASKDILHDPVLSSLKMEGILSFLLESLCYRILEDCSVSE
jgi:hypothetical protein